MTGRGMGVGGGPGFVLVLSSMTRLMPYEGVKRSGHRPIGVQLGRGSFPSHVPRHHGTDRPLVMRWLLPLWPLRTFHSAG
jgi:hypothetical protein